MQNSQLGAHGFLYGSAVILVRVHVTVESVIAETIPAFHNKLCVFCHLVAAAGSIVYLGYFLTVLVESWAAHI